jgi:predicted dehydrogenase
VHILDAVLWMLGNPPIASVSANTFAKAPHLTQPPPPFTSAPNGPQVMAADDVEDYASAFVRFQDGSTLAIESSWLFHPTDRPNGAAFLAEFGEAEYSPLAVRFDRTGQVEDRTPTDVAEGSNEHYFVRVARDFIQAARAGHPTVITAPQMLQVQALIDGIYESARLRREVEVSN